jgi:PAS domain S-box-containing protein
MSARIFLRKSAGYLAGVFGIAAVTAICVVLRSHVNEMTVALAMLLVVLFVAAAWESWPAIAASVLGMLCLNYYFLPPIYTLTIDDPKNWVALTAFFITAVTAGRLSAWAKQHAAEAEASRSQARLASTYNRSLLEATLDPLMTVGHDGLINDVNAAAETLTGSPRGELIGTGFAGHFTEPERARGACDRVFRGATVRGYALELRHRGGHSTSILFEGSLYRDASGNAIGLVAAAHPIGTYVGNPVEMRPDARVVRHLSVFTAFAAVFSVAVGLLSLIGIAFDIAVLKSLVPGDVTIKANTAVCLMLLGFCLWAARQPRKSRLGQIAAGLTALVGLLTIAEYLFGWDLGIDQLLYREPAADTVFSLGPGLMSPIAALDFLFLGLGLLLLDWHVSLKSRRLWPVQYLASISAILAIVGLLDFLLGFRGAYTHIALHTAFTLLVISLAVLSLRIDRGVPALLASSSAGGALTRRLLPAAAAIPALIGALAWYALAANRTSAWGAISFMTIAMIVLLTAFSVWNGYIVNRGDLERETAQGILQRRQLELREAERLAHVGSWWRDAQSSNVTWSPGLSYIAGRDPLLPPPTWEDHLRFFTPPGAAQLDAAVRKAMETGASFELDLEMLRTDGAVRQVTGRGEAERDPGGQVALVRGSIHDVTERRQAQEALRRSAEEISDLYNRAPCGYHSLDPDGVFLRINDTELEWLQYTREEVIGKRRFTDFLTREGSKIFARSFPQFKAKGVVQDLEFDLVRKDGTTFPVLLTASAITDAGGHYVMSRSTVYDITERKREEQSRAQLAAIVESSDDAIISKTLDERILTWNKGAEHIFGYQAQEIVGRSIEVLVPPDRLDELHRLMQSLKQGESTGHLETVRLRKDGRAIDVALTASPIRNAEGEVVAAATISRDITDRKRAENEIRQLAVRQAVVAELGEQALRSDPFGKVLDEAVARLAQLLGVDYTRVLELLPDKKTIFLRAGTGWKEGLVGHATALLEPESQAAFTLLVQQPVVLLDLREEKRFRNVPMFGEPQVTSGMSVVITTSAGPYGILAVHTRQRRTFTNDEVTFIQSVANVLGIIVERRRAEEEVLRINRAHRALSSCNEALIRASDESALLGEICRIITEQAGYRFCWVGRAEQDEAKSVQPLAQAGFEEGYLKTVNITWADTERGRGPTGTCVRTGAVQLTRNLATESSFAPWREEALKRGYASSLAVPLTVDSKLFGALTIYSSEIEAFGAEEVKLLAELAGDLGYGITTLRGQTERIRAEEEVRRLNADLEHRVIARTAELHAANKELEQAREREIEIGFKIQQTLLLDQPPTDVPGLRVAALTIPSQRIDGDFYIFIRHADDCLDVIVGDVMGKGIPAALLGAATKSHFLKALSDLMGQARNGVLPEPKEIVMLAHAELVRHLIDLDSFVTLVYARFDESKRSLQLVDCGHTGTIHLHSGTGRCEMLHGDNLPLGVREGEIYDQISVPFEPGDLFVFFSDGITEARSRSGGLFSDARLEECVTSNRDLQPEELVAAIRKAVFTFTESNQLSDDLTAVAVRVEERQLPAAQAEIEIASDLKNLRQAREFVRGFCGGLFDEDGAGALELAVNEAASNIMKHAYHGRSDQWIHLEAEAFPSHVTIRLHHLGDPFDPSAVPPPSLDGSRESGFGAWIIARSVDQVRYYRDERGRNCIALVKLRKSSGNPQSPEGKQP